MTAPSNFSLTQQRILSNPPSVMPAQAGILPRFAGALVLGCLLFVSCNDTGERDNPMDPGSALFDPVDAEASSSSALVQSSASTVNNGSSSSQGAASSAAGSSATGSSSASLSSAANATPGSSGSSATSASSSSLAGTLSSSSAAVTTPSSSSVATIVEKVATPSILPAEGTYAPDQLIAIATTPSDAEIRYTLNGSTPTSASSLYTGPFALTQSATVNAKAFKAGYTASSLASATYTLQVAQPTVSPNGGNFTANKIVELETATSGASIYYTLDGNAPSTSSTPYTDAFSLAEGATLKAIAVRTGCTNSAVKSVDFTFTVTAPVLAPAGGNYSTDQSVAMSTTTNGAEIRYTTDGSEPTASSPLFTADIAIADPSIVKAKAFKTGWIGSTVTQEAYAVPFTDVRDGNEYKTTYIGESFWMAENLKFLPSVNGKSVYSSTEAKYYVYDYDGSSVSAAKATVNYNTYGVLYNWAAAMAGAASSTASPSGVRGLCPDYWHMPSYLEWLDLVTNVGSVASKLKSIAGWNSGGVIGTNESSFSALPGGVYDGSGGFSSLGSIGSWWTSTETGSTSYVTDDAAYAGSMYTSNVDQVGFPNPRKEYGSSVRCVK